MIQAQHTILGEWIGRYYSGYKLTKAFQPIRLVGEYPAGKEGAVLLIANHFSWWDGFIQYRLNLQVFRKKFYVMMQEEQLVKNKILRLGGAFSVRKGSRQIMESLRYSIDLLKNENSLVLLFPQGNIQSMHTPEFRFQKGVEYLLKHTPEQVQLIFNVNLIDYFSEKRPSLSIYYRPYQASAPFSVSVIEDAFNAYAQECKRLQYDLNK